MGLGSQVFALGYPAGVSSLKNNYPLAKTGYLASLPGEEFEIQLVPPTNHFSGKVYLVDGLIVGGNSGGPVILPSTLKFLSRKDGQLSWLTNPTENYVIGLVSQTVQGGLSLVYSSDYIRDAIEIFENRVARIDGNVFYFK